MVSRSLTPVDNLFSLIDDSPKSPHKNAQLQVYIEHKHTLSLSYDEYIFVNSLFSV